MSEQELLKQFHDDMVEMEKCCTFEQAGDECTISCKLGLWSVRGPNDMMLINEAARHFEQFKTDGEYSELLNKNKCTTTEF